MSAARSLLGSVDAIFISNDNTALASFPTVVKAASQNQTPVFASDGDLINEGALAVLGPNQYELGKQTALMVLQVLQNKKPLPAVEFPKKVDLLINETVAKELKIKIPPKLQNR
jgi:putative ABC transport system substrate-binding protein